MKKCKHQWGRYNNYTGKWKGEENKMDSYSISQLSGDPYITKCQKCGIVIYQTSEYKKLAVTYFEREIPEKIYNKVEKAVEKMVKEYYKKV